MSPEKPPVLSDPPRKVRPGWLVFFAAGAMQSFAALAWLVLIPGDPKHGLVLGFSASRLAMMAAAAVPGLLFLLALIFALRGGTFSRRLEAPAGLGRNAFFAVCAALGLVLAAAWLGLVSLRADPGEATYAVYERLLPVLSLLGLLSLESLAWLVVARFGINWGVLKEHRAAVRLALGMMAACAAAGMVVALTGFGITPDEFFWGSPGVPLLAWQIAGSALIVVAGFGLLSLLKLQGGWKTDLFLFLVLWGGAYLLWMSQPVPRSFFTPSPRAPNFEVYPYSDAGFYDYVSHSLLTGNGFMNGQIITRPLYAVMLAAFHTLVGQDYNGMVALQTVLLALFPALLFLLGKTLHSREAGLLAGLLAVWREMNLLAATPLTEVSNSKMLLTDSITGLAICGLILWMVWWQKEKPASLTSALAAGGMLGLMLLLRSQSLILLPAGALVILANRRIPFKRSLAAAGLFLFGAVVSFSPWLWRNYQLTGLLIVDQPSQAAITATRFATSWETVDENLRNLPPAEVSAHVTRFVRQHPLYTLKFMTAHFLNNEFSSLTILPLRAGLLDARDNWTVATPFWLQGLAGLSAGQILLLAANLAVVIAGLAFSYWKLRWTGLIPFVFHLAYSFTSGMGRISGWRFVQPVDWVIYLYFAVGLGCLFYLLLRVLGWRPEGGVPVPELRADARPGRVRWGRLAGLTAAFFLLGSVTPAVERLIPRRYPVEEKTLLIEKIAGDPRVAADSRLKELILSMEEQDGAVALWGRALYPRFYLAEKGEHGSGWLAYKPRDFAKLGFVMITPSGDWQAVLPAENPPEFFPNAGDVLLVGCQRDGWIESAAVLVGSGENKLYLSSQPAPFECE